MDGCPGHSKAGQLASAATNELPAAMALRSKILGAGTVINTVGKSAMCLIDGNFSGASSEASNILFSRGARAYFEK